MLLIHCESHKKYYMFFTFLKEWKDTHSYLGFRSLILSFLSPAPPLLSSPTLLSKRHPLRHSPPQIVFTIHLVWFLPFLSTAQGNNTCSVGNCKNIWIYQLFARIFFCCWLFSPLLYSLHKVVAYWNVSNVLNANIILLKRPGITWMRCRIVIWIKMRLEGILAVTKWRILISSVWRIAR